MRKSIPTIMSSALYMLCKQVFEPAYTPKDALTYYGKVNHPLLSTLAPAPRPVLFFVLERR